MPLENIIAMQFL